MSSQNIAYQLLLCIAVLLRPATQACDSSAFLINTTAPDQMATIEPDIGGDSYVIHFEGDVITEDHMETEFSGFSISFQNCQLNMACEIVDVISNSSVSVSECNSTLPPFPMTLDSVDVESCNGSDGEFYGDSHVIDIIATVLPFTDDAGCDHLNVICPTSQAIEQCSLTNGSVCDNYCINPEIFVVTYETKKKLEDFCECLSVQGVDCVNKENHDVCTSFCELTSRSDQRPSCGVFEDGFDGDVMCDSVCTNLTSPCTDATFSLEDCTEQCRAPRDQGTLCWFEINTFCQSLIFDGLYPNICEPEDLTRDEVNTIINDYIAFVLDVIRDLTPIEKVDIFQSFLFLGAGCDNSVTAMADEAFIKLIACSIDGLLSNETSDIFVEIPQDVLRIVETVSRLLSERILQRNVTKSIIPKENIYLQAEKINFEVININDNYSFHIDENAHPAFAGVEILIPLDVFVSTDHDLEDSRYLPDAGVSVVITRNLASSLNAESGSNSTTLNNLVTVYLVRRDARGIFKTVDEFLDERLIRIVFPLDEKSSGQNFLCVFFDRNLSVFSEVGVSTVSAGDDNSITCTSTHLTSFAVLVNVGGVEQSQINSLSLSIVSYIGLVISLIFLLATITFFLTFGKKLLTAVHNFVHLNLAIALFLAYLCFALGVELAARNKIACTLVTALLHYLFLAVFFWMLCEGVMLYLMLRVIFSTLSKKWWFFLMLGWLPPIAFVVIGLSTVLNEYGVYQDNMLVYCWLSSGNGTYAIWTFVAPMIAIILINVVFLVIVLISLIRSQNKKHPNTPGKKRKLVIVTIKASFVLLPLLGLTWVFGLLIVNRKTVVFAWIFTILNSLQGLLIFFFHVLMNEKVRAIIEKYIRLIKRTNNQPGKRSNYTHGTSHVLDKGAKQEKTDILNKEMERYDHGSSSEEKEERYDSKNHKAEAKEASLNL